MNRRAEGAEAQFEVGRDCAAAVVGSALPFALTAPPWGLRRAQLRAKPQVRKTTSKKKHETKRAAISIEVSNGTFLKEL